MVLESKMSRITDLGMDLAASIAGVQPVRGTHFPLDIVAGALVGLAAEWLVARAFDAVDRRG